jgi:hypothetical protein
MLGLLQQAKRLNIPALCWNPGARIDFQTS